MLLDDPDEEETPPKTPLPVKQVGVLFLMNFSGCFQFSVMWPMVPFMVAHYLGSNCSEEVIGYYVGILESSFFIAQFMACIPWGSLSDKIGRRPVLLYTSLGSALALLGFGFAPTFILALCSRILSGILDGSIGIIKTYLGEILDKSNKSNGFSLISFSFGISNIVAPMLGGLLINRWDAYPFALPSIVGTIVGICGFLAGLLYLPETQVFLRSKQLKTYAEDSIEDMEVSLIPRQNSSFQKNISEAIAVLWDFDILVSTGLYGLIALAQIIYDEVLPIFCRASIKDNGLGFTATKIGILLAIQGAMISFYQLVLFKMVVDRFGLLRSFRWSIVLLLPTYAAFPYIAYAFHDQPVFLWTALSILMTMRAFLACNTFTCIFILISNSTTGSNLGAVNGLGQSFASLSRSLGPLLGGSLWSYGHTIGLPYASYILCGIVLLFTLWLAVIANASLEEAKIDPVEE